VRAIEGQGGGFAGGERNTSFSRMALTGLVAALRHLPAHRDVQVHAAGPALADLPEVLAGHAAPEENLDLWAQILTAVNGRRLTLDPSPARPETPLAFAAAWAEMCMDKAKTAGAFSAAIPKGNLAKVAGLG
jgi:NAD(P)-dependent dehydrogenase (short-subunit alcohol dehydrogenase family)